MAGLIQSVKDPILVRIIKGVESKIPKEHRRDYQAIVTAGLKVLASDRTHHFLVDGLKEGQRRGHVPQAIVTGVVKLIALILKESRGRMSMPMAAPAAVVLLCYVLQYAEAAIHAPVTADMAAQLTHAVTVGVLRLFKIDQHKFAQGVDYARDHRDQFAAYAPQES